MIAQGFPFASYARTLSMAERSTFAAIAMRRKDPTRAIASFARMRRHR